MLTPDDYGVLSMVLSFVGLAAIFKDLGLSSAAIQKADLTVAQQSNLFWINAIFGLLLSVLFATAAPVVSWFYGRPELVEVTWVLSLTFVLGGLSAQHHAMMVRNMWFGRQGLVAVSGIAATFAASFTLASLGYGFWALVWGHVVGAAVRAVLTWRFSPFSPSSWKCGVGTREMTKFGANVTGFNFVNYFSRNFDNVLIGKFAGADALGIYGRAYQLMLFPVMNLRAPIDAVTYPVLCQLQGRPKEWRHYHMQTLRILAFLTMPLVAWMFLNAEPLILLLLGENWAGVVPLFRILAIVGFIQPCAGMVGSVMLSVGHSRRYMLQGSAMAIVLTISFSIGIQWGAQGVAWAYVAATYISLQPMLLYAYKDTSLRVSDFFVCISQPAILTLSAATVSSVVVRSTGPYGLAEELMMSSIVFGSAFGGAILILPSGRSVVGELKMLIKNRLAS
jgi:PST family polysaccharide transporter